MCDIPSNCCNHWYRSSRSMGSSSESISAAERAAAARTIRYVIIHHSARSTTARGRKRLRTLGDRSARHPSAGSAKCAFFRSRTSSRWRTGEKQTAFETTKTAVLFWREKYEIKTRFSNARVRDDPCGHLHCRRSKAAAAAAAIVCRGEQQVVGVEVNAAAAAGTVGRDERTSRQHRGDWRTAAVARRVGEPRGGGWSDGVETRACVRPTYRGARSNKRRPRRAFTAVTAGDLNRLWFSTRHTDTDTATMEITGKIVEIQHLKYRSVRVDLKMISAFIYV